MNAEKVPFANALRGIAALAVIVSHYLGVFWTNPDAIKSMTGLPGHGLPVPSFVYTVNFALFNWGAFGVALFFIISGFVIPFSFHSYRRIDFLVARLLRIYPTYWVGLTLGFLAVWLASVSLGSVFPHTPTEIGFSYALGIRDIAWSKITDGVVWTLEIELKFYLICALAAPLLKHSSSKIMALPVLIFAAAILAKFIIPMSNTPHMNFIALSSPYLIYMFIGVILNFHYRGKIGTVVAASAVALIYAMFALSLTYGMFPSPVLASYALALLVFISTMVFPKIVTAIPTIGFWSSISYPLYVAHALTGYVLIRVLLATGMKAWLSILIAFVLVSLTAFVIHATAEQWSQNKGRHFAARIRNREKSNVAVEQSA